MIFRTAEDYVDGDMKTVVQRADRAKKTQANTDRELANLVLRREQEALNKVIEANELLAKKDINAAQASTMRANAVAGLSDEVQDLARSEKTGADEVDAYIKKQQAQINSNYKVAQSFKGISAGMKAMALNIGAELAIALALQAVMWGLQKLNEEFHITAASKVEAMENAVNNYNDALEKFGDNIDTIKGLEEEFFTLARGVNDAGENIGLSADEYERYHEIVAELVAINPELVQGYDDEGNAIINRNSAIEDGIKLQEEYQKKATSEYVDSGKDIIKGARVEISKALDEARKEAGKLGKIEYEYAAVSDNAFDAKINNSGALLDLWGDATSDNDLNSVISEYFNKEIDLAHASLSTLKMVDKQFDGIMKLAKETGYTDEQIIDLRDQYGTFHNMLLDVDAAYQPIKDWLIGVVNEANEAGKTIASSVPEGMNEGFLAGLEEIAYTGTSYEQMKSEAKELAETLKAVYDGQAIADYKGNQDLDISEKTNQVKVKLDGDAKKEWHSYNEILESADDAKKSFDKSNRDTSAVEEYNKAVKTEVKALDKLADKWEEIDPTIAAAIRSQARSMESYAQDTKVSIQNAVGQFDDLIKAARGAKETFDAALEGGDYYTAVEAYKEIYETMFDGQNNLGFGSETFWQGAEQLLGNDFLQEAQYDIDVVKAKLKEIKPLLEGGAHGAALLGEELAEAAGGLSAGASGQITDEFGNIIANVERLNNGAIKFDIDTENFAAVADALNISEEALVGLLDSARQFSNVDFSNTEEIRDAIINAANENDGAIRGRDGNVYMDHSAYAQESGLSGPKLQESIEKLEKMGIVIVGVNDDVSILENSFKNIASYNKNGSLNLAETVESYHDMGTSAEDLVSILTKVGKVDLKKLGEDGYNSIKDFVEEMYSAYDQIEMNPEMEIEVENTEAIEALNESLNTIIELSGGVPPVNIKVEGSGNLDDALSNIENLTDNEHSSVIEIVTQYNEDGDLKALNQGLNKIFGQKDSTKKSLTIDAIVNTSGSNLSFDEVKNKISEVSQQKPIVDIQDNTSTVIRNIEEVGSSLDDLDKNNAHVYIYEHTVKIDEEGLATGTPGRRKFSSRANGTQNRRLYSSVAKGKLGPYGHGGITLTGELGPELVWIPSEATSFIVGQYGPEMVDLPGDAVVYTADETRRIVGDVVSLPRPKFTSLANGQNQNKFGSALGGETGGTDGTLPSVWVTKKSTKKSSIDAYETELARLDHLLKMGYISEKTYYEKLQKLYNKHKAALKKNTEKNREALEAQRQAHVDAYESEKGALDSKLERGIINEQTYYNSLLKIGKTYYTKDGKIRDGYLDEWRQWQADLQAAEDSRYESRKDKLDYQLEMGIITQKQYYKKLTKLNDDFAKTFNRDEKRDVNLAERTAWIDSYESEKETLDSRRDRGVITESSYYESLLSLGKKYYTKDGKIRTGYLDEWRAWQNDLIDAKQSAYDVEQEALDEKLEKDLISQDAYWKASIAIKNKYLSGKALADEKQEAADSIFENSLSSWESDWDDILQNMDDAELFNTGKTVDSGINELKTYRNAIAALLKDPIYKNYYTQIQALVLDMDREIAQQEKDLAEERQDQLQEYMDLVEDMIRQEANDYIDSLEDQKDAFDDLISKRKEMLRLAEDERAFQEGLEESNRDIAKIQEQIDILSLDDSREAQAQVAKLKEELAQAQRDQNKTVREETISKTENLLDEQSKLYGEIMDNAIKVVEDWLNNKAAVVEVVVDTINNRDDNELYNRLIKYNGEFGDALKDTVDTAWGDLQTLTDTYGKDIAEVLDILRKVVNADASIGFIKPSETDYVTPQTHHTGLASGFTGSGADLKQHEVWRLLTDDELVLNRADQLKIGRQMKILDSIKSSYDSMSLSLSDVPLSPSQATIEMEIHSPITIQGNADQDTLDQLSKFGEKLANDTFDKLQETLLRKGVRAGLSGSSRGASMKL